MNTDTLSLIIKYMSRALMLFLLMPVLNYVKGSIAKKMGDDTAEMAGRITLNPMAHLDLLGSLLIMLIGFGWSKPMPINYLRMKNTKKGIILVALTGPLSLFLMSIVCRNISAALFAFLGYENITVWAIAFIFSMLSGISVSIGVLHLLPLPGMDGFILLYYLTGNKFAAWYHKNQRAIDQYSFYVFMGLILIGRLTNGLIDPIGWIINIFDWLLSLTTFWTLFIQ
jgi:Zn-dependent protease